MEEWRFKHSRYYKAKAFQRALLVVCAPLTWYMITGNRLAPGLLNMQVVIHVLCTLPLAPEKRRRGKGSTFWDCTHKNKHAFGLLLQCAVFAHNIVALAREQGIRNHRVWVL